MYHVIINHTIKQNNLKEIRKMTNEKMLDVLRKGNLKEETPSVNKNQVKL